MADSEITADVAEAAAEAAPEIDPDVSVAERAEAKLDDELGAIYDKMNQPEGAEEKAAEGEEEKSAPERGKDGKFVKAEEGKDKDGQPLLKEGEPKDDAEGTAAKSEAIARPDTWSPEKEDLWKTLSPEAQQHIAQREKEAHDQISRQGNVLSAYKPIGELLTRHKGMFDRNGMDFEQGISALLDAQSLLEQDPIGGIAAIAERYGITRQDLVTRLGGQVQGANGQQAQVNPEVSRLESRITELQNRLAADERERESLRLAEERNRQTSMDRQVADWAKDKPHFGEVRALMADLLMGHANRGQELTLDQAYDMAVNATPSVRAAAEADRKAREESERQKEAEAKAAAAKKVQAINAGSSRAGRPAPKPFLSEDHLEEIYDRAAATG